MLLRRRLFSKSESFRCISFNMRLVSLEIPPEVAAPIPFLACFVVGVGRPWRVGNKFLLSFCCGLSSAINIHVGGYWRRSSVAASDRPFASAGRRHMLPQCSWGHNTHAPCMEFIMGKGWDGVQCNVHWYWRRSRAGRINRQYMSAGQNTLCFDV